MTEFDKARISELEAENAKLIDSSERTMRDRERMSVSIDALSKQLAAVTKERDELREHLSRACDVLDEISGKTCRLGCHKHATKALIRIERDALPILIDSEDK